MRNLPNNSLVILFTITIIIIFLYTNEKSGLEAVPVFRGLVLLFPEPREQDVDRRRLTGQDGNPQLSAQTPAGSAQNGSLFHP